MHCLNTPQCLILTKKAHRNLKKYYSIPTVTAPGIELGPPTYATSTWYEGGGRALVDVLLTLSC